ncbi:LysM peptidoglycan-binding domain-containing protein, partial [Staphylococcus arlettae]
QDGQSTANTSGENASDASNAGSSSDQNSQSQSQQSQQSSDNQQSDQANSNTSDSTDDSSQATNNDSQGQRTHVVNGQNLYRIAIQYYGEGSPENVEKIREANGISGNDIHNGQRLVIPQ